MARGLTSSEFVKAIAFFNVAIPKLRNAEKSLGAHCRFSGLNTLFGKVFPGVDVRLATQELEQAHKIALVPARGGVMVYRWEDRPASYKGPVADKESQIADILSAMEAFSAKQATAEPEQSEQIEAKQTEQQDSDLAELEQLAKEENQ